MLNTYKGGNQAGFPESTRILKNSSPIAKQSFKFSNQLAPNKFPYEGSPTNFSLANIDANYPTLADYTTSYDASNSVVSVQKLDDVSSAYIWGYNNSSVTAKVLNATPDRVAYSSFENATSNGGWNFTYDPAMTTIATYKTGGRAYFGNQTITKTGLPVGNYTVAFWAKANNGTNSGNVVVNGQNVAVANAAWEYKQITLTAITSVTINFSWLNGANGITIDELRLFPPDAKMSTYSYAQLLGVTSVTDSNGKTEYYEYDATGRLKLVRNSEGNIVKSFDYNYRQ